MRNKKAVFICQISDDSLRAVKCFIKNYKRVFSKLSLEKISAEISDKDLKEKLSRIFKDLDYNNNDRVIVSLARNYATCRYIKIPTKDSLEIEKIVALQASRYLPYPADELISSYQLILADDQGYSHINLGIVYNNIIERYVKIFEEFKISDFNIFLSSYGLYNLYSFIRKEDFGPVILLDVDPYYVELAIISQKKLLFSRYFKFNKLQLNWENNFIYEIEKSQNAYLREIKQDAPNRIVVFGENNVSGEIFELLNKQNNFTVERLFYGKEIGIQEDLLNIIRESPRSFSSLIGFGIGEVDISLNLLPREIKEKARRFSQRRKQFCAALFIFAVLLLWGIIIIKNLDNKAKYLEGLKTELSKIEGEAKPLEDIEKRFTLIEKRAFKRTSTLDILYDLHKIIPAQISLTNFNFEDNSQILLRGQTSELNAVFMLVSKLKESGIFQKFTIKVKYATNKKTKQGETVDFEIICSKNK